MNNFHHINCGTLLVDGYPTVVCHCLLVEGDDGLVLVDSGIGMQDVKHPRERLGQELIDMAGFQFNEHDTALRRIESLGFVASDVRHIVLTHCDPDHTGGLADFPDAMVHVSAEEMKNLDSGQARYVATHFQHEPNWKSYGPGEKKWFGLESRPVEINTSNKILLVPLFGHTLGHCGVAIETESGWLLHAGDAYYLRDELTDQNHPVSSFAALRADDDGQRIKTLGELRRIFESHPDEIEMTGYHDINELPEHAGIQ